MTQRSVTHATFAVERTYEAAPERVFAAFASVEAKLAWSACHTGQAITEFDFREGGRERARGEFHGGGSSDFQAQYHEIVEGERIVLAYDMFIDEVRISVSLQTVEFAPAGKGTRLRITEQGAWLDGHVDPKMVEEGTGEGLDNLTAYLARETADA